MCSRLHYVDLRTGKMLQPRQRRLFVRHPWSKKHLGGLRSSQSAKQSGRTICLAVQLQNLAPTNAAQDLRLYSYGEDTLQGDECISMLSAAMEPDPSTAVFCRRGLGRLFYRSVYTSLLRSNPTSQQIYSIDAGNCIAICYMYPRQSDHTATTGWWSLPLVLGLLVSIKPRSYRAAVRTGEFLEAAKGKYYKDHGPFLYICTFATRRGHQRRGLGRQLLACITSRADEEGLPCFLEATTEHSREFYRKYGGFEDLMTHRLSDAYPAVYIMHRPAGAKPSG